MGAAQAHVYLIPGLFGFARMAGHDYFEHMERNLRRYYRDRDRAVHLEVVPTPPTASLLTRAAVVAAQVAETSVSDDGPIHLIGHSTGGLDARLLLTPSASLGLPDAQLAWLGRVRSLVTINCPHFGTPLAGYFTTVAGTRLLYALSLLTITSLSIGKLPLTVLSSLLASLSTLDDRLGLEVRLLDELTEYVLRYLGEQGRAEVGTYLAAVQRDRGGIVQLMPEVMSVFNAVVCDRPGVRYGCIATAAPEPGPRHLLSSVLSPLSALSRAIYAVVHEVASTADQAYPYGRARSNDLSLLAREVGHVPDAKTVDGIVPTLSMLWGELLFGGEADHLDVVGHFEDDVRPQEHVDWLESGANFRRSEFSRLITAIGAFQMRPPAPNPRHPGHGESGC